MSWLYGICDIEEGCYPTLAKLGSPLEAKETLSRHHRPTAGVCLSVSSNSSNESLQSSYVCPSGSICTLDGRLHNRTELLRQIRCSEPELNDAGLALTAYQARGLDGLRDLIGDWSLALWSSTNRTLLLASDFAGVRPLYWTRHRRSLLWSSSLHNLAQYTGASPLDEQFAADFMTRGFAIGSTPYIGISPVAAGQTVSFVDNKILLRRFWNVPIGIEPAYRQEQDYEEEFRHLFRDAVAVRLRSTGIVCAELSGGLDSSSVVCMANQLIRDRVVKTPTLVCITYTLPGSTDEKFSRFLEKRCNLTSLHVDSTVRLSRDHCDADAPHVWWTRFKEMSVRIHELGAATLLTGQIGDLVTGNWLDDSEQIGDYLWQGRPIKALASAARWSRHLRVPVYFVAARNLREYIFPCHPSIHSQTTECEPASTSVSEHLLNLSWQRERERLAAWHRERPSLRKRLRALTEILDARRLQCPAPLQGISVTHPFAHRPLVEFLMNVPGEILCGIGEPRRLMRRSLSGLVPNTVLARRSKTTYNTVYLDALRPFALSLLPGVGSMQLVKRGYVQPRSLAVRLRRLTDGLECNSTQLMYVILLEFWLRHYTSANCEF